MNNSISIYNRVLAISLVVVAFLCFRWFMNTREMRYLQPQLMGYQQRDLLVNQLVSEVMAYSEKNPAVDPILISIGAKQPKTTAPVTPKK